MFHNHRWCEFQNRKVHNVAKRCWTGYREWTIKLSCTVIYWDWTMVESCVISCDRLLLMIWFGQAAGIPHHCWQLGLHVSGGKYIVHVKILTHNEWCRRELLMHWYECAGDDLFESCAIFVVLDKTNVISCGFGLGKNVSWNISERLSVGIRSQKRSKRNGVKM
jgi:hypothetical protein